MLLVNLDKIINIFCPFQNIVVAIWKSMHLYKDQTMYENTQIILSCPESYQRKKAFSYLPVEFESCQLKLLLAMFQLFYKLSCWGDGDLGYLNQACKTLLQGINIKYQHFLYIF